MDTNQKIPSNNGPSGESKQNKNRRRPYNRHGKRRPDGRPDTLPNGGEIREAEQAVGEAVAPEAESTPKKENNRNRGDRHQPRNGRDQNRGQDRRASDKKAEMSKADANPQEADRADGADRKERSVGRPQRTRNSAPQKKASTLPQMDNLLIGDCPEEIADLAGNQSDTAELERILSYDLFRKDEHVIPEVIPEDKVVITGVRFRAGGKTYFFDPGALNCTVGTYAVVETARGLEFGEICIANRMVDSHLVVPPLRPVVRLATAEDLRQNELNHKREAEAFKMGKEKIKEHGLDMKLVSVQYTFDNSKLLFYFTSDGRVDFRDLVKDLAGVFHIRIELRQIGIRDEARMLGGLGACGRPLCCATFLSDFGQVSMKMAKEQNLTLNSTKISGCCGRLMCCLRYEHETYAEALRELPNQGSFVITPDGPGVVTDVLPLEGAVKVSLKSEESTSPKKYLKSDITLPQHGRRSDTPPAEDISEPDSDD